MRLEELRRYPDKIQAVINCKTGKKDQGATPISTGGETLVNQFHNRKANGYALILIHLISEMVIDKYQYSATYILIYQVNNIKSGQRESYIDT